MTHAPYPSPNPAQPPRDWRVMVVGGPSGAGKTRISRQLSRLHGIPVVEVDDIVEALLAVTEPEHLPLVHYWRTHPEAAGYPPERIVELQVSIARALAPAVAAVIANHVQTDTPVIVEGDYILPSVAAPAGDGLVRAVFVHEEDEEQLVANFLAREPAAGPQRRRARVSLLYGRRLADQASALGLPVVAPRPWHDSCHRVTAALALPQSAP